LSLALRKLLHGHAAFIRKVGLHLDKAFDHSTHAMTKLRAGEIPVHQLRFRLLPFAGLPVRRDREDGLATHDGDRKSTSPVGDPHAIDEFKILNAFGLVTISATLTTKIWHCPSTSLR
jgi:hypothetical protein